MFLLFSAVIRRKLGKRELSKIAGDDIRTNPIGKKHVYAAGGMHYWMIRILSSPHVLQCHLNSVGRGRSVTCDHSFLRASYCFEQDGQRIAWVVKASMNHPRGAYVVVA
jgi:hypothetical protein